MARILVADDCSDTRLLMRLLLEREGHQVTLANDGPELFRKWSEIPMPDVVLADFTMPGFDPAEFVSFRESCPARVATPVFFVTGADPELVRRMVHGVEVLSKPVNLQKLICSMEEAIDARRPSGG